MRHSFIICFLLLSFIGNSQEILNFPAFSDDIKYEGCEEYRAESPRKKHLKIMGDTLISLNQFDNKLDISLRFKWDNNSEDIRRSIGVLSIEVLKDNKVIQFIDMATLSDEWVYWNKGWREGRKGEYSRDDIALMDFNFDGYLDLYFKNGCGSPCNYDYILFNKEKQVFEVDKVTLSGTQLFQIDCKRKMLFTYDDGSGWYYRASAYKVEDGKVSLYQQYNYESYQDYSIKQYKDANGKILKEIKD